MVPKARGHTNITSTTPLGGTVVLYSSRYCATMVPNDNPVYGRWVLSEVWAAPHLKKAKRGTPQPRATTRSTAPPTHMNSHKSRSNTIWDTLRYELRLSRQSMLFPASEVELEIGIEIATNVT